MLTEQRSALTDDRKLEFWREGYLVVDDVFTGDEVELLRRELAEIERRGRGSASPDVATYAGDFLYIHRSLATESEPLRRVPMHPRLLSLVEDLMQEEVCAKANGSLLDKAPGEQSWDIIWHQDHGGYEHREQTNVITARVALDDVSPANGGMYVIPRTHHILMEAGRGISVKSERYEEIREVIRRKYEADEGVPIVRRAGSVMFYVPLLLHRAGHNTSASRRRVLVYGYRPASLLLKGRDWPATVYPEPLRPVKSLLAD